MNYHKYDHAVSNQDKDVSHQEDIENHDPGLPQIAEALDNKEGQDFRRSAAVLSHGSLTASPAQMEI